MGQIHPHGPNGPGPFIDWKAAMAKIGTHPAPAEFSPWSFGPEALNVQPMAIFAVIHLPISSADRLPAVIEATFPGAFNKVAGNVWLVAGVGTARDISERLGVTTGENGVGSAIVLETASYYGRANPAVWSWIKTNWEGVANGG